jgi:hypothetical protein
MDCMHRHQSGSVTQICRKVTDIMSLAAEVCDDRTRQSSISGASWNCLMESRGTRQGRAAAAAIKPPDYITAGHSKKQAQ